MVTYTKSDYIINGTYKISGECLSGDTKPTDVANGSKLIEMDTGKVWMFDADNELWRDVTA